MDLQIWLMVLLTCVIVIPSGVVSTFSATIIRGFGYTPKESALLNMPSGVVSIIATMLSTWSIARGFPRWISIILFLVPELVGGALMAFTPAKNLGGRLAGIYMVNFAVGPLAVVFTWVGANTMGYTKRVAGNSLVAFAFGIGNIIGPQTFQAKDAPRYVPAIITVMVVSVAGMFFAVALRLLYGLRNKESIKRREQHMQEIARQGLTEDELDDRRTTTDRQDLTFVYVY